MFVWRLEINAGNLPLLLFTLQKQGLSLNVELNTVARLYWLISSPHEPPGSPTRFTDRLCQTQLFA